MESSSRAMFPDSSLQALFGDHPSDGFTFLRQRLEEVGGRIVALAGTIGERIGQVLAHPELRLAARDRDALLYAEPYSDICGVAFEVGYVMEDPGLYTPKLPPPWTVESSLYVLCDRQPLHTDHCIHDLLLLEGLADSPRDALAMLEQQVVRIESEALDRPVTDITAARHDDLTPRDT